VVTACLASAAVGGQRTVSGTTSREESVRTPQFVLAVGLALSMGACSDGAGAGGSMPPLESVDLPASAAGGACILLDYPLIEKHLGVRFDIAAADQAEDTSTCVVQSQGATRPDLVLSVVERTSADAYLFLKEVKPAKGKRVTGLGKAAYKLVSGPAADRGPTVEVGWLTFGKQLMTLRFTYAEPAPADKAEQFAGRLIALADAIDGDDPVEE
jgi:hypothetical protein